MEYILMKHVCRLGHSCARSSGEVKCISGTKSKKGSDDTSESPINIGVVHQETPPFGQSSSAVLGSGQETWETKISHAGWVPSATAECFCGGCSRS